MQRINWQLKQLTELSGLEVYRLCKLRQDVFVIEQQCLEPDLDNKDNKAWHLLAASDAELLAYARIFAPADYYPNVATFGRVAVAAKARGTGLGKQLTQKCVEAIEWHWPQTNIEISAQYYLLKFYQTLGFQPVGETYWEAGIEHIRMIR